MWQRRYYVAFAVAAISDLMDYTPLGALPIIGDAIDAATLPILYRLIGRFSVAGLLEFIPLVDLLPTYTIAVAVAYFRARKKQSRRPAIR